MRFYRAVKNRCAVDIDALALPLEKTDVINLLRTKGFKIAEVDMVAIARERCILSTYRRGARLSEAPEVVDCSGFVKWLYAQKGVWIPRRSIQQREFGEKAVLAEVAAGDLVFSSGRIDYYFDDPEDGVGHVGIATGEGTVIHAASREVGVVESPLEIFVRNGIFRGVRRVIPLGREVITIITPPERDVETSDDIRWIILQSFIGRVDIIRQKTTADSL